MKLLLFVFVVLSGSLVHSVLPINDQYELASQKSSGHLLPIESQYELASNNVEPYGQKSSGHLLPIDDQYELHSQKSSGHLLPIEDQYELASNNVKPYHTRQKSSGHLLPINDHNELFSNNFKQYYTNIHGGEGSKPVYGAASEYDEGDLSHVHEDGGYGGGSADNPIMDEFELARHILEDGYANGGNGTTPATVYNLMHHYLKGATGSSRVFMMRMIEIMDMNKDYLISKEEFVHCMAPALARPEEACRMIFKLYDLNEDNIITKYEWATVLTLSAEADVAMMDIWRQTSQDFHNRDYDQNGVVDENEFIMNEFFELAYAIGNEMEENKITLP